MANGRRDGSGERFTDHEGKYLQDRERAELQAEQDTLDEIAAKHNKPVEPPKGEDEIEVPYLGWVELFSEAQNEAALPYCTGPGKLAGFLKYHVPTTKRGKYKLDEYPGAYGERKGPEGYALCTAMTQTHNSRGERIREESLPCRAKAINHSGKCSSHGGMLHPFDKLVIDWSKVPREIAFRYGKLPVEALTDEELARGQVRKANGSFTRNKTVDTKVHDQMVKQLFARADEKMRENLLAMVDTMTEIATGTAYEPADRLRAAEFVFKWLRGSTPVKVDVTVDAKPFEEVLNAVMQGGSRAESRRARGLEDVVDAEIVGDVPDLDRMEMVMEDEVIVTDDEGMAEVVVPHSYADPEDRTTAQDLEPERVVHIGPAGKETYDVPPNLRHDETDMGHWEQVDINKRRAEAERKEALKKRPNPGEAAAQRAKEVAEARKQHKDQMKASIKKRKGSLSRGYANLPESLAEETTENEDGTENHTFRRPE